MKLHKSFLNIVIVALLAAICTGGWAYFNRPVYAPDWPEEISGFSYSPYRSGQKPNENIFPTDEQIREDRAKLATFTDNIRIYSSSGDMQRIPAIAHELGLTVTLGIWLDKNLEKNASEINAALDILEQNRNIRAVFVGNEALFREDVRIDQLIGYLDEVRAMTHVPVATAEPWHIWIKHPELAPHVDLIAAHVLPFWQQEIKDEHKESEGSPELKGQIRRRQYETLNGSTRQAVAEASVIITNPTHFAVALRYKPGVDAAPVVVARGSDAIAAAIRELADQNGVTVLQYPELARAIYFTSRTGQKHRDRAMAIGVNDYLGKPYQESVLLESIAYWSKSHA